MSTELIIKTRGVQNDALPALTSPYRQNTLRKRKSKAAHFAAQLFISELLLWNNILRICHNKLWLISILIQQHNDD